MRRTPATAVIIALNVIAFIVEVALGAHVMTPSAAVLLEVGGNHAAYTLAGEPWRLVTAMFLHGGLIHLAMNMYCLYMARELERLIGPALMAAVYLFAGLIGGVASLLRAEPTVSVGASGAVFGIFGAYAVVLVLLRRDLDDRVFWAQIRSLLVFLGINLALGLMVPNIDMLAHAGGLVGGAVAMWLASRGGRKPGPVVRAAAVLLLGVGISAAAVSAMPAPIDPGALLLRMARVEDVAIDRYNQMWRRLDQGELTQAEARRIIDDEVLPPWRAMRVELEGAAEVPERFRPAVRATATYFGARQEAFELVARALGRATREETEADLALRPEVEASVQRASEEAKRALDALLGKGAANE
ncbi:MAG: rhomboid family intramembrane serine protease [Deltaproteobacteria bacterium]|nr:rhomboid family intramembrane serine protease [Deltaproteobacteria bacterium]